MLSNLFVLKCEKLRTYECHETQIVPVRLKLKQNYSRTTKSKFQTQTHHTSARCSGDVANRMAR